MKILQIIPAPKAMRIQYSVKDKPEESWEEPVACLALVMDEDGETRILAVSSCDCGPDFDGEFDIEHTSKTMRMLIYWEKEKKPKPGDE